MTSRRNPTNADISRQLGGLDQKVTDLSTELSAVHAQVRHTNGRVTKLEQTERERIAVEAYKKANPPAVVELAAKQEGWSTREKALVAFITALLAIVGTLVGVNS